MLNSVYQRWFHKALLSPGSNILHAVMCFTKWWTYLACKWLSPSRMLLSYPIVILPATNEPVQVWNSRFKKICYFCSAKIIFWFSSLLLMHRRVQLSVERLVKTSQYLSVVWWYSSRYIMVSRLDPNKCFLSVSNFHSLLSLLSENLLLPSESEQAHIYKNHWSWLFKSLNILSVCFFSIE